MVYGKIFTQRNCKIKDANMVQPGTVSRKTPQLQKGQLPLSPDAMCSNSCTEENVNTSYGSPFYHLQVFSHVVSTHRSRFLPRMHEELSKISLVSALQETLFKYLTPITCAAKFNISTIFDPSSCDICSSLT